MLPHLPTDFDLDDTQLLPAHRAEWVDGSGVDPAIVDLNVRSIAGEEVLDLLVGDQLEAAGAHGQQYATAEVRRLLLSRDQLREGGWTCGGVDLQNGCRDPHDWRLFKPDNPRPRKSSEKDGEKIRYEHAQGKTERLLALRMLDRNFWPRIKADPSVAIVLDEGAKKAGAYLTAGIPAIALPGIYAGTPPVDPKDPEPRKGFGYGDWKKGESKPRKPKKRKLHPDLVPFTPGRTFVISFDYEEEDWKIARRDHATRLLAEQLYAAGAAKVLIAHREGPEKGADDLLLAWGPAALKALIARAKPAERGAIKPHATRQKAEPLFGDDATRAERIAARICDRLTRGRQEVRNAGHSVTDLKLLMQLADTPGLGKSHLVPELGPRLLGHPEISCVVYVSSTYRSPSIEGLKYWTAPPTRHSGLVQDVIQGEPRLRRRKTTDTDDQIVEPATCQLTDGLQRFRDSGAGADATTYFCSHICPHRIGCSYLVERQEFIHDLQEGRHRLLRCSVEGLPMLQQFLGEKAWENTFLIFDEAPQITKSSAQQWNIKLTDFPAWATWLRTEFPDHTSSGAGQQLIELLDGLATIKDRLEDRPLMFGATVQELRAALPLVPAAEDLGFLLNIPTALDLLKGARGSDPTELLGELQIPTLLVRLLQGLWEERAEDDLPVVAYYNPKGTGAITVVACRPTLPTTVLGCAGALVMDGTAELADIKRHLHGGWPDQWSIKAEAICSKEADGFADLEIVQIRDLGALGRQRGADIQRRVEALFPALREHVKERFGPDASMGIIEKSHFRDRDSEMGVWFVDDQGSNAFKDDKAIALAGAPMPNLVGALAYYQVAYYKREADLNDEGFRKWYGRGVGERLLQAIHRLRPVRRQGEQLLVFLITDTDLSGIDPSGRIIQRASGDYTRAAAPKAQRTREKVIQAIRDAAQLGHAPEQITTRKVAEIAGVSKMTPARQAQGTTWPEFVLSVLGEER